MFSMVKICFKFKNQMRSKNNFLNVFIIFDAYIISLSQLIR